MHYLKRIERCKTDEDLGNLDISAMKSTVYTISELFASPSSLLPFIFLKLKNKNPWGTIMRYHYHLSEYPQLKRLTPPNTGEDKKQLEFSYIVSGNIKWYKHFEKRSGGFL